MENFDLASLLKIDISSKELEQLKQTLKKCQRLDYNNLPKYEKSNFDKFFVSKLRDIHLEVVKKQETNQFLDMKEVFTEIMDMMETQIKYVETINAEMGTFKNSSLRPKKQNTNYNKRTQKSF